MQIFSKYFSVPKKLGGRENMGPVWCSGAIPKHPKSTYSGYLFWVYFWVKYFSGQKFLVKLGETHFSGQYFGSSVVPSGWFGSEVPVIHGVIRLVNSSSRHAYDVLVLRRVASYEHYDHTRH